MVHTEVAAIVDGEVYLIVVGARHVTRQVAERAIGTCQGTEVAIVEQCVVVGSCHRCVEVAATT